MPSSSRPICSRLSALTEYHDRLRASFPLWTNLIACVKVRPIMAPPSKASPTTLLRIWPRSLAWTRSEHYPNPEFLFFGYRLSFTKPKLSTIVTSNISIIDERIHFGQRVLVLQFRKDSHRLLWPYLVTHPVTRRIPIPVRNF